jgi:hypothetical protein
MRSSDSQENDREKRLPGWEREEASDDLLDPEVKEKLESYKVPKERDDDLRPSQST